jgi:hypothetical protein
VGAGFGTMITLEPRQAAHLLSATFGFGLLADIGALLVAKILAAIALLRLVIFDRSQIRA